MEAITPAQAAKLIGCSEYTIRKLAREKKIPSYRIASKMMFNKVSLENWVRKQEEKSLNN